MASKKVKKVLKTKKPAKKNTHKIERVNKKSVIDEQQLATLLKKGEERGF